MKATTTPVPDARPCEYSRGRAYDAQSWRTGIVSGDYAASVGYANGKAATGEDDVLHLPSRPESAFRLHDGGDLDGAGVRIRRAAPFDGDQTERCA